jgi:hypothetical protein
MNTEKMDIETLVYNKSANINLFNELWENLICTQTALDKNFKLNEPGSIEYFKSAPFGVVVTYITNSGRRAAILKTAMGMLTLSIVEFEETERMWFHAVGSLVKMDCIPKETFLADADRIKHYFGYDELKGFAFKNLADKMIAN